MTDDLAPVEIDLNAKKKEEINEFFLKAFGSWVELALRKMFGQSGLPNIRVKGTKEQIKAFSNTLKSEKKYMDAYQQFGLDNPQSLKSKYRLDKAVKDFERKTSLRWPFK